MNSTFNLRHRTTGYYFVGKSPNGGNLWTEDINSSWIVASPEEAATIASDNSLDDTDSNELDGGNHPPQNPNKP